MLRKVLLDFISLRRKYSRISIVLEVIKVLYYINTITKLLTFIYNNTSNNNTFSYLLKKKLYKEEVT